MKLREERSSGSQRTAGLDPDDIQGIVLYGYGKLLAARFLLLQVADAAACRVWIGDLAGRVHKAHATPRTDAINIAFTHGGLSALGLDDAALSGFPRELQEGMTQEHRTRLLGDFGANDPNGWTWGGPKNPPIHAVLMLYAVDIETLESLSKAMRDGLANSGMTEVMALETSTLKYQKEQFGFHDGISQPEPMVSDLDVAEFNRVRAGEFILGYTNEYGEVTSSPRTRTGQDVGRNGSYMVFRQLQQDVRGFWEYCDARTHDATGNPDPPARLMLAAKMVGRWPSGVPLVDSPESDPLPEPSQFDSNQESNNSFLYSDNDPYGMKCPLGSHVRRTFPRDTLAEDRQEAIKFSKRHRLLRRGREYGTPIDEEMRPQMILDSQDTTSERGLHFICFNANISRQFEFVQHTWMNNPKLAGLYSDPDPIASGSTRDDTTQPSDCVFTAPGCPARSRVTDLPSFVTVRGGAYFFTPSITALRYLARMNP